MSVKERSVHIAPEAEFSTDPGEGAFDWVPATGIGDIQDEKAPIKVDYFTNSPWQSGFIPGPDGGQLELTVPRIGLADAAEAGGSPGALDWSDQLDRVVLGEPTDVDGVSITSLAGTALDLGADVRDVGDMACLVEGGLPAGAPRAVFAPIVTDNSDGTYVLGFDPGVPFTGAAASFGYKRYSPVFPISRSFALVYRFDRDKEWTLLGCTIIGYTETIDQRGAIMRRVRIAYDRAVTSTKTLTTGVGAAVTPIVGVQCLVMLDGTVVASKKTTIDLAPDTVQVASHGGLHGRAANRVLGLAPKITIEPEWQSGLRTARRGAESRSVLVQLGGGDVAVTGGALNTGVWYAPRMAVVEESPSADGKLQRQTVTFEMDRGASPIHPLQFFRP